LKPPKDVLELGKHLVRELDFEDSVDTLGRWMAHHLAELIYEAENGETEEAKLKASQQATETILKIWEHRKNLPRDTYPLAKYKDLLRVIDHLRIDNNPYRFFSSNFDNTDKIASILFDNFARLILSLLFIKMESLKSQKVAESVIEALDEEEKQIWLAIQDWFTVFPKESDEDGTAKKKKKRQKTKDINLKKNSVNLINNINKTLIELKHELDK
jgi:hypothetical protein